MRFAVVDLPDPIGPMTWILREISTIAGCASFDGIDQALYRLHSP
jgi:hypothetical protein